MDKLDKPGLMNRSANVYVSKLIDKLNEVIDKVNELESKHEQAMVSSKTSSKASGRSKRGTVRQSE